MTSGGSSPNMWGHDPMASAEARADNGRSGAEPSSGVQGKAPGQGAKSPWRWSTYGFWTFNGSRKFARLSKIRKREEIRYLCYFCKKIMGGHETGGLEQNLGRAGCAPPARA